MKAISVVELSDRCDPFVVDALGFAIMAYLTTGNLIDAYESIDNTLSDSVITAFGLPVNHDCIESDISEEEKYRRYFILRQTALGIFKRYLDTQASQISGFFTHCKNRNVVIHAQTPTHLFIRLEYEECQKDC